jgi:hypothetical protein
MYSLIKVAIVFFSSVLYCGANSVAMALLIQYFFTLNRFKMVLRQSFIQSCIALLTVIGFGALLVYACNYVMIILNRITSLEVGYYCQILKPLPLFAQTTLWSLALFYLVATAMHSKFIQELYRCSFVRAFIIAGVSNGISCSIKFIGTHLALMGMYSLLL